MKNEYYQNIDFGKVKLDFTDSDSCTDFFSQAGQDVFVLSVLDGKKNGIFLEVGASDPKIINNTYLLEKKFDWTGVQIEIDEILAEKCSVYRNTKVICNDATKIDYDEIFNEYPEIDYLSLDIDGLPSLEVLRKIKLNKNKIKVITFEHDSYKEGDFIKIESRKIFDDFGYYRICADIANENNIYEDWYVHPNFVDVKKLEILKSESKNWNHVLFH